MTTTIKYLLTVLFFLPVSVVWSQTLAVTVEGNATFGNTLFAVNEAGEDFQGSVVTESPLNVSVLSGDYWDKKNNRNNKWRIFIYKTDLTWNPGLILEAARTGAGYNPDNNGSPNISDGESFQTITNNPTYFFLGKDQIAYIPVNLRLSGISVTMGAKNYETNVVLTVYDDW